jgi:hypothetical protein
LEDDWIIVEEGEICVWCLLNHYANSGQSTGILYVYPEQVSDTFSWVASWNGYFGTESAATPSASRTSDQAVADPLEPLTGAMAWALFNPATNCRH